jgi:hypothetical protein
MIEEEFDRLMIERLKRLQENDPINASTWKSFIDRYSKKSDDLNSARLKDISIKNGLGDLVVLSPTLKNPAWAVLLGGHCIGNLSKEEVEKICIFYRKKKFSLWNRIKSWFMKKESPYKLPEPWHMEYRKILIELGEKERRE